MQSAMLAKEPRSIPTHETPMQDVHALMRMLPSVDMHLDGIFGSAIV